MSDINTNTKVQFKENTKERERESNKGKNSKLFGGKEHVTAANVDKTDTVNDPSVSKEVDSVPITDSEIVYAISTESVEEPLEVLDVAINVGKVCKTS